jgi:hypothetical protein
VLPAGQARLPLYYYSVVDFIANRDAQMMLRSSFCSRLLLIETSDSTTEVGIKEFNWTLSRCVGSAARRTEPLL